MMPDFRVTYALHPPFAEADVAAMLKTLGVANIETCSMKSRWPDKIEFSSRPCRPA